MIHIKCFSAPAVACTFRQVLSLVLLSGRLILSSAPLWLCWCYIQNVTEQGFLFVPYSLQVTQSTDHNVCRSCSLHPVLYCLPAIHTANHSICRLNTIQSADYTFCRPSVCRLYILQTIQSTDHTVCLVVGLSAASITSYGSGNCPFSQKKTLCVRQSIR